MRARSGRAAWLMAGLGAILWVGDAHAEPRDEAKRYFLQGLEAAKSKDFEGALDKFLAAQDIYPHPVTLYNIARAYYDLGNLDEAIAYFELYVASKPEARAEIEPMIATLKARQRQGNETVAVQPTEAGSGAGTGMATAEEVARREIAPQMIRAQQIVRTRRHHGLIQFLFRVGMLQKDVLNSYYRAQLMGFLYKQG